MSNTPLLNGVSERAGNGVLADYVFKDLRPPFESQYLVGQIHSLRPLPKGGEGVTEAAKHPILARADLAPHPTLSPEGRGSKGAAKHPVSCLAGPLFGSPAVQELLRHSRGSAYRCSLPGLTGFTGSARTGPEPQDNSSSGRLTVRGVSWRRGWDSNPRYGCPYTSFPGSPNKPLLHPSSTAATRGRSWRKLHARFARWARELAESTHYSQASEHYQPKAEEAIRLKKGWSRTEIHIGLELDSTLWNDAE